MHLLLKKLFLELQNGLFKGCVAFGLVVVLVVLAACASACCDNGLLAITNDAISMTEVAIPASNV